MSLDPFQLTRKYFFLAKSVVLIFVPVFLVVAIVRGNTFIDPDFGWHLATGKYILEKGFPKSDPFSYTMPDFPYVDHSWFVDVLIAYLYPVVGMLGLSILFSSILLATLYLTYLLVTDGEKKQWYLSWPSLILIAGIFCHYFLVRPQVISWFFTAILFNLISKEEGWRRWRIFMPAFFLIWANIHGGFSLGLTIFLLFGVVRMFVLKRIDFEFIFVWSLSIFATLINPYGIGLWREVVMTLTSGQLRSKIVEWMPVFMNQNISFVMLVALSIVFMRIYQNRYSLYEKTIYLFLLISGMISTKQIPFWALFSQVVVVKGFLFLSEEVKKYKKGVLRFRIFYLAIAVTAATLSFLSWYLSSNGSLKEEAFYPKKALIYLKENKTDDEVFSEYGWGGYLIWKLPEKKVFIDGRMAIWKQKSKSGNLNNSFETYGNILSGKEDLTSVFKKFNVDTVLWPTPKTPSLIQKISHYFVEKLNLKNKEDLLPNFNEKLARAGFTKVYGDTVAEIYRKKN